VKIVFLYHNDDTEYTKQYYQSYLVLITKLIYKNVLHFCTLARTLSTDSASCELIFCSCFAISFRNKYLHKVSPIINATPYCSSAVFDFEMCLMRYLQ
jgi:hypothetical protein